MFGVTLGRTEEHAFFILFIAVVLIIFWYAVWELLTELTNHINTRHGIEKWKIYTLSLTGVLLLIGIFPQILKKI